MRYTLQVNLIATLVSAVAIAEPPPYEVTDLGVIADFAPIEGYRVNARGAVAGIASRHFTIPNAGGGVQERSYVISRAGQREILIFNGGVVARGINSHGQVAGTATHYSTRRGFVWRNGTWIMLSPFNRSSWSWVNAINDQGQVVGGSYTDPNDGASTAILWEPDGTLVHVGGASPDYQSAAIGINNCGDIVGNSDVPLNYPSAVLWRHGEMIELPRPSPRRPTLARDINDAGLIVGYAEWIGESYYEPLAWRDGIVVRLPTLEGRPIGEAHAVNNSEAIVGYASAAIYEPLEYRAVLWINEQPFDLNTVIAPASGWLLTHAEDVSDTGYIVGRGFLNGERRGFVLTPAASAIPTRQVP